MTTERIDIVVTDRGSRVVKRNLQAIGNTAVSATRGLRLMQNALFVLGGAGILRGIVRNVDSLNNFRNRLRLVTRSTAELNAVQQELFDISVRTRTAFATTATVFTRTAFNTKELGLSMKETLAFTEALNKAVLISGANAREAEAATIQLSQAIASDRFSGDELRSVLEQLPFAADVIAKGVKATRGELRQMGKDGKITADKIIQAFLTATTEIDSLFGQLVSTVGQSFTNLETRFLEFLSKADQITGFSQTIIDAVSLISNNLDSLIPIVLGVAVVMITRFLGPMIGGLLVAAKNQFLFTQSVLKGEVAIAGSTKAILIQARASNQLAVAEAKIISIQVNKLRIQIANNNATVAASRISLKKIGEDIALRKGIIQETGQTAVLNKLIKSQSIERQILTQAVRVNTAAKKELLIVEAASARASGVVTATTKAQTAAMGAATLGTRILSGALGLLRGALALVGGVGGLILLAATAWLVFGRSSDTARKAIDSETEALVALNKELRESAGLTTKLKNLKLDEAKAVLVNLRAREQAKAGFITSLADQVSESKQRLAVLRKSLDASSGGGLTSNLTESLAFAKESENLKNLRDKLKLTRDEFIRLEAEAERLDRSIDGVSEVVKNKLNKELEKLRAKLDPVINAKKEMKKVEDLLTKAILEKNISDREANKLLDRQRFLLREQLKPFETLLENLKFENSLINLSNTERRIEIELKDIINKQKFTENALTGTQIKLLREELRIRAQAKEDKKIKKPIEDREAVIDRVLENMLKERDNLLVLGDARRVLVDQLKAEEQIRRALRKANPELDEARINELAKLTNIEKQGVEEISRQVSEMGRLSNTVEGIFADAKSAIVDFANTGKLSIGSLFDSIQQRITQLAADQLFEQLFGLLGGAGKGGGFLGSIFSGVGSLVGIPGADTGGSFQVGGSGGVDNNIMSINGRPIVRVSKGENVSISPRGSSVNDNRPVSVTVIVNTPDARSFQSKETQNQIAQGVGQSIQRAVGRND